MLAASPAVQTPSVEEDTPRWAEPLGALYARIRYQSYLLLAALGVILVEGVLLYRLGSSASAHVYEVRPDGEAAYIGDRTANVAPRPAEAQHVARAFVELLYAWNSSTVAEDATKAVNLCSATMGEQLRTELATAQFVDKIRRRNIRSEVSFSTVQVLEQTRRDFRVQVAGAVTVFGLAQYEGAPLERRPFAVTVVLDVVPRDPESRLNGLEVARIVRDDPAAPPHERSP